MRARGFSLLEVLVALTVVGLVMAAAVPAAVRFYDNLESRAAVRNATTLLAAARETALSSGRIQDVYLRPATRRIWHGSEEITIPAGMQLTVHGAAELNQDNTGVIRFYPDGSASGGGVDFLRPDGSGTRISVDWLIGSVRQYPLSPG